MQHVNPHQHRIARDSIERYSGSACAEFQPYLLLTNFPAYLEYFAKEQGVKIHRGSAFSVAHSPEIRCSMLNFGLGSPSAALVIDLISHLHTSAVLLLGMCGGLRRRYQVGDYLVPVASIRGEGTSNFYFAPEVPALANFHITQACSEVLRQSDETFHYGITYCTNIRFWEFDEAFKHNLRQMRAQAIEMECATLFAASYRRRVTAGALLLISDLPLNQDGVKTKHSARQVIDSFAAGHVQRGIEIVAHAGQLITAHEERKRQPRPVSSFVYQPTPGSQIEPGSSAE